MATFKKLLAFSLVIIFNVLLPVLSVKNDIYQVADDILYETFPFIKPPPEVQKSTEYRSEKFYFENILRRILKYKNPCNEWTDVIPEIKNEWAQKFGLTKLAYFCRGDNNYKFNWALTVLLDLGWPLDTLKEILIKTKNYKMLIECLDRGLQFNDSDLRFVKEAFQIGREFCDTGKNYPVAELCYKMIEKKVIITGMEETAFDYLMHPAMRSSNKNTAYLKDLINRPINPDKRSSQAVLQLIRKERYDWAVMLLEKGWPVPNLNNQDLRQIRESNHKGMRQAFPGIRALFQKPI